MKRYQTTAGLIAMLAITSAAAFGKTISDYAEANLVLGQTDFISKLSPNPPNAASLNDPCSVIVDPVTRKVFVAEEGNNRVLRYASADALASGAAAEAVFGQALFTTRDTEVTSNQFGGDPESIFLDAKGRLWVPDYAGSRVLRFDFASLCDSSPSANRVYGQPDFTTGSSGTTAAKMDNPYDVCVDAADRLWVADSGNHRVLRFDSISTKPSGAAADGVLGQADFLTGTAGSGNNGLQFPSGVTISANGTLYVTCYNASRVMRFDNAAGLGNNAPANAVLGQPDFATTSTGITAAKLDRPNGAWITPDDSLWVADSNNNRVLRFNNASTKPSGASADGVLGQPDFTSKLPAVTRSGMDFPYYRPFVDATGSLWIAEGDNHRVLRFSPDATPPLVIVTPDAAPPLIVTPKTTSPLLAMTTVLKKFTTKAKVTLSGTASDKYGISKVEYRIGNGPFKLATITTGPGTTAWSFKAKLKKGRNVITIVATDVDGIASLSQVIKIKRK